MFRFPLLALLICCITLGFAQDTVKKTHVIKPFTKYRSYKYHRHRPYNLKTDSGAIKPGVHPSTGFRHDTVAPPSGPVDKSLNGQYQYLLSRIYRYQQPEVSALWKSATDTLSFNKRMLKDAQSKLTTQAKMIDSLKTDASSKAQSLNTSKAQVDDVNILGVSLSKTAYSLILWGLVLVFGITAAVVISRSAGARHEAKYRAKLYEELEEDFKAYKAKANDKEIKLARELQTERNKVDELMGRG
ncbi:MAG: hypothetical protein JWP94_3715 [Mucilaginibacter sp.]|jgi:hypothetical protein|nr:hypothetical protein [Mucilaginibacter sp.]